MLQLTILYYSEVFIFPYFVKIHINGDCGIGKNIVPLHPKIKI